MKLYGITGIYFEITKYW